MSLSHEPGHGDQQLVRYLLGLLSEEEAERLEELSIVDEDVTWRLRAVENDLVDAYVSGALAGETLERFESFYLSSALRRDTVRFAASLLRTVNREAASHDQEAGPGAARATATETRNPPLRRARWRERSARRRALAWGLAAAAAVLLIACGALLLQDVRLRQALVSAQTENAALARRARELEQQLSDQRRAAAQAAGEQERARAALGEARQRSGAGPVEGARGANRQEPTPRALSTVALVLVPQTRATGPIATVTVPPGTDGLTIQLRLAFNDFPGYQAALKDPGTNQHLWRSGRVAAKSAGGTSTVSVLVPASLLKPQHYSIELSGLAAGGGAQVIESYTFRLLPR